MRHRLSTSVIALLILAAFGRSALVVCAGWSDSAAVRAACCHASHCDQAAADDCCARGETRQHPQVLQSIAPALVPAFHVVASASPVEVPTQQLDGATMSASTHRPGTYLLLSVLLV